MRPLELHAVHPRDVHPLVLLMREQGGRAMWMASCEGRPVEMALSAARRETRGQGVPHAATLRGRAGKHGSLRRGTAIASCSTRKDDDRPPALAQPLESRCTRRAATAITPYSSHENGVRQAPPWPFGLKERWRSLHVRALEHPSLSANL